MNIFFVLSALLVSIIYSATAEREYTSNITLSIVAEDSDTISRLANQFSGIASLAGLDIQSSSDKSKVYLAILESRTFIIDYINTLNIKREILSESWDETANQWKEPSFIEKLINEIADQPQSKSETQTDQSVAPNEPLDIKAYEEFTSSHLSIIQDRETGFINVRIKTSSPQKSMDWLVALVNHCNDYIRNKDKIEAEKSINYLKYELENTNSVEMRQAIFNLIEAQTKTVMLTNVRKEYAYKILDYPVYDNDPSHPKPIFMIFFTILSATAISALLTLLSVYKDTYKQH